MKKELVTISINPDLLKKIEKKRGLVKRSTYLVMLIERGLKTLRR